MKKVLFLGLGLCMAFAFSSCKSSESAYKKAYEKAKQNELANAQNSQNQASAEVVEATPVVPAAPVVDATPVQQAPATNVAVREEKVELVSGNELKAFSIVCGSFGVKANADGLKAFLDNAGYNAKVVFTAEKNMYRVISESFDTKEAAAAARDAFKQKYSNRADFQGSWLLYRVY